MEKIGVSVFCIFCAVVSAILLLIGDNIPIGLRIFILCIDLSTIFLSGMNIEFWRKK